MKRLVAVALTAAALASCGRKPDGGTWMIMVGGDTVTVAEVGRVWNSLPERTRQLFQSRDNPLGEFLLSYARRIMVEDESKRLGYLERPSTVFQAQAWERLHMSWAAQETLVARTALSVTRPDLDFFRDHLGITVWFTETSNRGASRFGPVHLAEMASEEGVALAGLRPGQSARLADGTEITLDSTAVADSAMVAQALADTTQLAEYARSEISRWRAQEVTDSLLTSAKEASPPFLDTLALSRYSALQRGDSSSLPSDTLLRVGSAVWTVERLGQEIAFESTLHFTAPSDPAWLEWFAGALVDREIIASGFREMYPGAADSISSEASLFAREAAADSIYDNFVVDSVTVTDAQMDSAWAASPPEVPESRAAECVLLPDDQALASFRQALSRGDAAQAAEAWGGLPSFCPEGGRMTPPMTREQVPCGLADSLFALAPSDTLDWIGPAPLAPLQGFVMMRLARVLPAHPASREEADQTIRQQLRSTFMDERTNAWLAGLEEEYGLSINEKALNDLPPDLSTWADL